ncbi:MAG TPA: glycosyl hydrolase family 28-related protein [Anaerolineaceae bacterium]|nr:glycosyl hydrolase family 28-related protein [Anaerolineaceae bacterium]
MKKIPRILNLVTVLILLLALGSSVGNSASSQALLPAADIIPSDRRIDWSYAGIPGGIPDRTAICATLAPATFGNGTIDAAAAIQNALDSCPDGQVVYLQEGSYLINSTVHLYDYDTLRGAGPGKTVLHTASSLRSMVDMRGSVYYQISSLHKTHPVLQATKDSKVITLASASGISSGDILLINQLNDNVLVDPVGVEGKCTYCGYENGDRVLGQLVEVTAVAGNQVTLNLPLHWTYSTNLVPWAYQVDAYAMIRNAGLEDLTLTQDNPVVEFVIEMDGAQYSWVKNVEIKNIQRRAMWIVNSLQNEIRESYVHVGIDGYGRDRGYGIFVDLHSSNNLLEDNILSTIDGGGIMTGGGASGNVIAYNYFHDILFDDPWWLTASPSINHNPHPKMNLWEGDTGIKAEGDIIHGSSSHNTIFRSQMQGWQSETTTTRNNAIEFAAKNTYMNVVGSVLGTPGKSNRYEVLPGQPYDDSTDSVIWALGVGSGVADPNVAATLLRHGNFDYVTNSVVWDPSIPDHVLPVSLYRTSKPNWWCQETPWPPIGPDVTGYANDIPAKRRFEGLPCTQASALILNGVPANQAIYLTWQVSTSLPVTATWDISYAGPPGLQPSPISGLPAATRAFTLTGLANYFSYPITLTARQNGSPLFTTTITVMPTPLSLHLPIIF